MPGPTPDPRRQVVRDAVAVALAVAAFGVSFGATAVDAGLSPAQASALSLLVFTGASQFAFASVLISGGSALGALAVALLLATRNALYALRVRPLLDLRSWRRVVVLTGVIDESVAMATAHDDDPALARFAFLATAISVYSLWNLSTLVGALAGNVVDPQRLGLDVAFPAAFLALLADRLRDPAPRRVALLAVVVTLALVPLAPAGVPVIAAAAAVVAGVSWRRPPGRAVAP